MIGLDCNWSQVGDDSSDVKVLLQRVQSILEYRLGCIVEKRAKNYDLVESKLNLTTPIETQGKPNVAVRKFVERIFSLYHMENGYHSFKHAAHVVFSVDKIIDMLIYEENKYAQEEYTNQGTVKRRWSTVSGRRMRYKNKHQDDTIKAATTRRWSTLATIRGIPDDGIRKNKTARRRSLFSRRNVGPYRLGEKEGTSYTLGLGKDPLIHFALVFAALVHDVDHKGIPNKQLVAEGHELARIYKDDSIAELHSLTLAFSILHEKEFADLRQLIAATRGEKIVFRKLVTDLILTTDISSKKRSEIVRNKWKSAFTLQNVINYIPTRKENVIELKRNAILGQIMLVADIAHTMQEWETFVKWNHNLFIEVSQAYHKGQCSIDAKDPSEIWFEDQIGFFNGYVIPLAQRMVESGIFLNNGHEFVKRAKFNCERWKIEGRQICRTFFELQ